MILTLTADDGTTIQTWSISRKDAENLRHRAGLAEEIGAAVRFADTVHGQASREIKAPAKEGKAPTTAGTYTRCPDCGQTYCIPSCKGWC